MAPRKKAPVAAEGAAEEPAAEPAAAEEIVEEIVPDRTAREGPTFVLEHAYYHDPPGGQIDEYDEEEDDGLEDGEEDDDDGLEDDLITAVGQLTQLMMTEEGEAITDVLNGVRDAIEKQNKILYRGLQLLEQRR